MSTKRRTISFVLYPEFQLLDAAGPIAAFEVASRFVPEAYSLRMTAFVRIFGLPPGVLRRRTADTSAL